VAIKQVHWKNKVTIVTSVSSPYWYKRTMVIDT